MAEKSDCKYQTWWPEQRDVPKLNHKHTVERTGNGVRLLISKPTSTSSREAIPSNLPPNSTTKWEQVIKCPRLWGFCFVFVFIFLIQTSTIGIHSDLGPKAMRVSSDATLELWYQLGLTVTLNCAWEGSAGSVSCPWAKETHGVHSDPQRVHEDSQPCSSKPERPTWLHSGPAVSPEGTFYAVIS